MAPRQIVILRHGEKPSDPADPDLAPAGYARATMLATLMPQRFPDPDDLFASARSKHSNRPYETIQPLAAMLHKAIDQEYADEGYASLAADLLASADYDGKKVIVCWHHGNIPSLGASLGLSQDIMMAAPGMLGLGWDPLVFDRFWILDFGAAGAPAFSSVLQQ